MRFCPLLALAACAFSAIGCRSAYIEATVTNHTARPIPLLELDYPSASFGTQNLAPGSSFHYRFKVLGSGPTKLLYTDASHLDHTSTGPNLNEGAEGRMTILLEDRGPQWQVSPKPLP